MTTTINPSSPAYLPSSLTGPAAGEAINVSTVNTPFQDVLDGLTNLGNITNFGLVDLMSTTISADVSNSAWTTFISDNWVQTTVEGDFALVWCTFAWTSAGTAPEFRFRFQDTVTVTKTSIAGDSSISAQMVTLHSYHMYGTAQATGLIECQLNNSGGNTTVSATSSDCRMTCALIRPRDVP